jgi:hypothetical protein
MEQTNVSTINGKPYKEPKGPPYMSPEQLRADLESTGERVIELTEERDELARRVEDLTARVRMICFNLPKGEAAGARRSVARVIAQVMSDSPIEPMAIVEELALVLTFIDAAEYAERAADEQVEVEL